MNLRNWSSKDREGLRSFYNAGQRWSYDQISRADDYPTQQLRNWIEELPEPRGHPLLLPAFHGSQDNVRWYAFGFNEIQAESLRTELNAFIGPVGSNYRGRRAELDPSDPIDTALFNWAGGSFVYRFDVIPGINSKARVRRALERMCRVWKLRPKQPSFEYRTTDALLREFFTALTNDNQAASRHWLKVISHSGRLSTENLRFLEIERLGEHGLWEDLAHHPHLPLLCATRRPRRVTAFLIEAVWRLELAKFVDACQAEQAVSWMKSEFLPRYRGLLRTRSGLKQTSVLLTFLLASAASEPPRRDHVHKLVDLLEPGTDSRRFADAVLAITPTAHVGPQTDDPVASVRELFNTLDFDLAWELIVNLTNTRETCELALECAQEINTNEAAEIALARLETLEENHRQSLLGSRRLRSACEELEKLTQKAGKHLPKSWEEWVATIQESPEWSQAIESARTAATEWNLESYRLDTVRVSDLAASLQSISSEGQRIVRKAMPQLSGFFLSKGQPESSFAPLYQSLLFILALDDGFGAEDWSLSQSLATGILDSGPSTNGYKDLVDALETIWSRWGGPNRIDWAMDLLDLLIVSPSPSPSERDRLFISILETFRRYSRRIRVDHWILFELLCVDLDREAEFGSLPTPGTKETTVTSMSDETAFDQKVVGIYTLTVSAAARAKVVLEKRFPKIEVRLNHDHVGSDRLESLSRESDYLIVVAKSAKHAATDFIKQKRPRNRSEIIYTSGRGSSSILTALMEFVAC